MTPVIEQEDHAVNIQYVVNINKHAYFPNAKDAILNVCVSSLLLTPQVHLDATDASGHQFMPQSIPLPVEVL